ncbi:MAG: hypothetical protein AAF558_06675 [Verrucomicrobiota bacterium]
MNRFVISVSVLFVVMQLGSMVEGQTNKERPEVPSIAELGESATYHMIYEYDSDSDLEVTEAEMRIAKITVRKSQTIHYSTVVYKDASQSDVWFTKGHYLFDRSEWQMPTVIGPGNIPQKYKTPTDFIFLDWVGDQTFQGEVEWEGKPCYHFKAEGNLSKGNAEQGFDFWQIDPGQVWIDQKTRKPLYYQGEGITVRFEYGRGSSVLRVPSRIEKRLSEFLNPYAEQARLRKLAREGKQAL